jgi:imidazolonepropionase-like amidohydrolase
MRAGSIHAWTLLLTLGPGIAAGQDTLALVGGTLIDGRGGQPVADAALVIAAGRIVTAGPRASVRVPPGARTIPAQGKFIIPGLMDANVHLVFGVSIEFLARHEGRFEQVIEEAAQVALKNGLTTVFDSWGPLQPLLNVRDRIRRRETAGSRLFVAGNIIGFTGPLGRDFNGDGETRATPAFVKRINSVWEEGTGPELLWLGPDSLRAVIRTYAARGMDFLKYGVSGHVYMETLLFSPEQQRVIVEEGHRAGLTVQTHSTHLESLRQAIELGVDLMQHCSIAGVSPVPRAVIDRMIARKVYCAVQPRTRKRLELDAKQPSPMPPRVPFLAMLQNADSTERRMIEAAAPLLLATDAGVMDPDQRAQLKAEAKEDDPTELGPAHFRWLRAMVEKGMKPMDAILAATRNVALAYRKLDDLGTLEPGKRADLLLLEADPLQDIGNVAKIALVMQDGVVIDRDALPRTRVLTVPRS